MPPSLCISLFLFIIFLFLAKKINKSKTPICWLFLRILFRVVIFEQPFDTTFVTIFFLSLFIGQKQWREEKEERENERIM